jgi:hypothetical protein
MGLTEIHPGERIFMVGIAVAFFVGAAIGLLVAALVSSARAGDEQSERFGLLTTDDVMG